jgi:hypothetical protein
MLNPSILELECQSSPEPLVKVDSINFPKIATDDEAEKIKQDNIKQ